jgi:hypothetical protein
MKVFEHGVFTLVPGDYDIGIGSSSADIQYQRHAHTFA